MNKGKGILNPLQAVSALVALAAFIILPVISFGAFVINVFHLNGLMLLSSGVIAYLILLLLLVLMFACSFGPLQMGSLILTGVTLVTEIVMMILAPIILVSSGSLTTILSLLPGDLAQSISSAGPMVESVLRSAVRPGLGMILVLVFTVLYGTFYFVNLLPSVYGASSRKSAFQQTSSARPSAYNNHTTPKI